MLITISIGEVAAGSARPALAWLLIAAFLLEGLGFWLKERQENLLIVIVRQLTYRRFRTLAERGALPPAARGHALTYPGQISQFAYVVDFGLTTLRILLFFGLSVHMYGASDVGAAFLIGILAYLSVRLVKAIGHLWEQYIHLEGLRRRWIQRLAESLPRGQYVASWGSALNRVHHIREEEERLLRRRVRLQVLNGFVDRGALTTLLSLIVIVGAVLWPGSAAGLGIVLAARYLFGAVHNNIVNYRVIRLAVPMMRDLDGLEKQEPSSDGVDLGGTIITEQVEVVPAEAPQVGDFHPLVAAGACAYLPPEVELTRPVVAQWRCQASSEVITRLNLLAGEMGLGPAVIQRLWADPGSLSTGERVRAGLALILAEGVENLVVDDSFAALDPATREVVAGCLLKEVEHLVVIYRSEEYLPKVLCAPNDQVSVEPALGGEPDSQDLADEFSPPGTNSALPDPERHLNSFWGTVRLLFGAQLWVILLGALLLCGAEVFFVVSMGRTQEHTVSLVSGATTCLVLMVAGCLVYFTPQFTAPITRLSRLHTAVTKRLPAYAHKGNSGTVVGRLGEDFSELQMSVPGALGSTFLVVIHTVLLIAVTTAGTPWFLLVIVVVAPCAVAVLRAGSARITPAVSAAMHARGEFLGVLSSQAGSESAPVSLGLRRAGSLAYDAAEETYLMAAACLANAYALRTGMLQGLVLLVNGSAVALALILPVDNSVVTPATVIYLAAVLTAGIQTTVEQLQSAQVVGMTASRVRALESLTVDRPLPDLHSQAMAELSQLLQEGHRLVALIGRTGSGKSVLVDAVLRSKGDSATLIPQVDPFAEEPAGSAVALTQAVIAENGCRLLLFDEAFRELTPEQERAALYVLKEQVAGSGRQAVVVLHSRSNLDLFEIVIDLDSFRGA